MMVNMKVRNSGQYTAWKSSSSLDLDNRRRRYLLDEGEPLPLAACAGRLERLRPLIVAAVGTGMRRGDRPSLRKPQADFQRDVVWVPNSKTGREYAVPMTAQSTCL